MVSPTAVRRDAPPAPDTREDRPAMRPYRARVVEVTSLSPSYRRVTLTSERFVHFGTDRLDQRIKLVLPHPDGTLHPLGADDDDPVEPFAWYSTWREMSNEERNPIRTYTVRDVDPSARTVTVDFVCHGDTGPATRWVRRAEPGDEIVLVGPDGRSRHSALGIDFKPGTAEHLLLAGDETAVPAICSILECLDPGRDVHVFLEVPTGDDVAQLAAQLPDGAAVTWLPRDHDRVGELLVPAVTAWLDAHPDIVSAASSPREAAPADPENDPGADPEADPDIVWDAPEEPGAGELYAWLAGEAGVIKAIRRAMVTTRGIDRRRVAFMGYWRQGRSENNG